MKDSSEKMLFDFSDAQVVDSWQTVDDRIMGGYSQSLPTHIDNVGLRFTGTVSLKNSGGFASIRSNVDDFDLGQFSGLRLRLRGDGKIYKISLRTDIFFDGVSYQTSFETLQDTWQEIFLPFETFTPTHHGIKLSTVAPMNTSTIKSFGLFIADRQEGSFQLDMAWIKAN